MSGVHLVANTGRLQWGRGASRRLAEVPLPFTLRQRCQRCVLLGGALTVQAADETKGKCMQLSREELRRSKRHPHTAGMPAGPAGWSPLHLGARCSLPLAACPPRLASPSHLYRHCCCAQRASQFKSACWLAHASLHIHKLDIKHEVGVGGDGAAHASGAVCRSPGRGRRG